MPPSDLLLSPSILRIGLYAPGERKPRCLLGPEFHPTLHDRRELVRILAMLAEQDMADLFVRVFSTDLRLVTADA